MVEKLLGFAIKQIVEHPDKVSILVRDQDGKLAVTITVDEVDVARVIGRDGAVLRALRSVARAVSAQELADFHVVDAGA
ncbi:KH domain-containing protein [bacterium]|nr:KH domain-containing protein [bacterium]MBT3903539.1 KH domain-containing protein [bacterium]MBT4577858.1 KH domain-containing protein [bacterium]MBT5346135.1 KH domain-containing protein [bacterium]MBT6131404.1 KH domain-containing protein [bacterium]